MLYCSVVGALLVTLAVGAAATDCSNPTPGTCTWYSDCLEESHPCGASGYALGYGGFYCNKFHSRGWTGDLEKWMSATGDCLQHSLIPILSEQDWDCDKITDYAFDSHPQCYLNNGSGISICDLPMTDKVRVAAVLKFSDMFSFRAIKQMWEVAKGCLSTKYHLQRLHTLRTSEGADNCHEREVLNTWYEWVAALTSSTAEQAQATYDRHVAAASTMTCDEVRVVIQHWQNKNFLE